jgi:hypothetical protein
MSRSYYSGMPILPELESIGHALKSESGSLRRSLPFSVVRLSQVQPIGENRKRMSLKRSKMVSFRLSPEEYSRLGEICVRKGLKSISDLARVAMTVIASDEVKIDPLSDQVRDIRRQVQLISMEVDRISAVLESRKVRAS